MDAVTLRKHAGMLQALAMLAKAMGQHKIYGIDRELAEQMVADLNAAADDYGQVQSAQLREEACYDLGYLDGKNRVPKRTVAVGVSFLSAPPPGEGEVSHVRDCACADCLTWRADRERERQWEEGWAYDRAPGHEEDV